MAIAEAIKTQTYHLHGNDLEWYEVEGEPVTIEGYEAFSFFGHNALNRDGAQDLDHWNVSEAKTGVALTKVANSKEEAIREAEWRLRLRASPSEFLRIVKKKAKEYGVSPSWRGH